MSHRGSILALPNSKHAELERLIVDDVSRHR